MIEDRDNNIVIDYEIHFSNANLQSLTKIHSLNITNQDANIKSHREYFLDHIIKIEISSDYDSRERKFKNYDTLMNQNNNPSLLLEFDPLDKSVEFYIVWKNPNGKFNF